MAIVTIDLPNFLLKNLEQKTCNQAGGDVAVLLEQTLPIFSLHPEQRCCLISRENRSRVNNRLRTNK